jgi:hypothetical protein
MRQTRGSFQQRNGRLGKGDLKAALRRAIQEGIERKCVLHFHHRRAKTYRNGQLRLIGNKSDILLHSPKNIQKSSSIVPDIADDLLDGSRRLRFGIYGMFSGQ